ncbi:MAG: hypothetical protein JW738_03790, partial [Actinobacteria bacterium]|nr:hypothetical protein [Actinomycetota bacterium]
MKVDSYQSVGFHCVKTHRLRHKKSDRCQSKSWDTWVKDKSYTGGMRFHCVKTQILGHKHHKKFHRCQGMRFH